MIVRRAVLPCSAGILPALLPFSRFGVCYRFKSGYFASATPRARRLPVAQAILPVPTHQLSTTRQCLARTPISFLSVLGPTDSNPNTSHPPHQQPAPQPSPPSPHTDSPTAQPPPIRTSGTAHPPSADSSSRCATTARPAPSCTKDTPYSRHRYKYCLHTRNASPASSAIRRAPCNVSAGVRGLSCNLKSG